MGRSRWWLGLWGLGLLLALPWAQVGDERVWGWFLRLRGDRLPPPEIVILAIDGESLEEGETTLANQMGSWPWKRSAYGQVIGRVIGAGARVVALDILFGSPSVHGKADDQRFQAILDRYGDRVVLAATYENSQNPQAQVSQLVSPGASFRLSAKSIGLVNYSFNSLGEVVQLTQSTDYGLLSFPRAIARAMGKSPGSSSLLPGSRINYVGFPNTWLAQGQQVPFFYVLEPGHWRRLQQENFFRNKIVLVGATADSLQDFQISPLGRMSGVEVNANAIATLLQDQPIRSALDHDWLEAGLIPGLIWVTMAWSLGFTRPLAQLGLNLAAAAAWLLFTYGWFVGLHLTLPVTLPVLAITLQGLSLEVVGTLAIQRERAALRRTLEQYVAAPIVNEILSQPDSYRQLLQGKKVRAAVLFCDVRQFTHLCSQMPPEQLIQQLNTYLSEMVEAVLAVQGTVDKFIGDEIMAEFGTPISQGAAADALNSVKAALAMRQRLVELRRVWQEQGKPLFFHGIGIDYGAITVGNIGSPKRLEYAAIGDTVNLASRVQGMTKTLGVDILITGAVYELVKDQVEVVCMGEQWIRGRSEPVTLYGLVELQGNSDRLFQEISAQLSAYLNT
ncbi:MAG: adenylate/guanylate cyclase domain-containing protein [Pseudanabaenaceae cyanobacterium bins.68]|nr:adenylate/guanylate cyclase domain-containing protein [Pseudanabaenaceae cyanobacterium bins.68]